MGISDDKPTHANYYPLFVALDRMICLVVGGGEVAERKIKGLLRCGATVKIAALKLSAWLQSQCQAERIMLLGDTYEEAYLQGVDLVFAATSDPELNRKIARDAQLHKVWCNMATDPERGSFIVPALFQQGPLTIAIGTSGQSPALARQIRTRLEREFGPEWGCFLIFMGLLRKAIQSKGLGSSQNQSLLRSIAGLPIPEWLKQSRHDQIVQTLERLCEPWLSDQDLKQLLDQAWTMCSSSLPLFATASEPSDI